MLFLMLRRGRVLSSSFVRRIDSQMALLTTSRRIPMIHSVCQYHPALRKNAAASGVLYLPQRNRHKRRPTVYVGFERPEPQRIYHILRTVFAASILVVAAFVLPAILDEGPSAALVELKSGDSGENVKEDDKDEKKKDKKDKVGFRDRKIIEYENRIRMYSTPDKVYRYFATLKVFNPANNDYEIYMTPTDFLRSITPGWKQPENLGLDQFKKFDPEHEKLRLLVPVGSVFHKIGQNGLISFSDYMFLLTLLSTPWRFFEMAFRMFDLNGDGTVDVEEFEKVQMVLRSQTAVGMRHRDHNTTGNVIRSPVSSGLAAYFFGSDMKEKLTHQQFLEFRKDFLNAIQRMEFERYSAENDNISEMEFATWLIEFAAFSDKKKRRVMKRVKKYFAQKKDDEDRPLFEGISWTEYHDFCKFLHSIMDVDIALQLHSVSGSRVDRATLDRVARVICGFQLSSHVLDILYVIFDDNGDDSLSAREFVGVMQRRLTRGLEHPKDTGFTRLLNAIYYCTKQAIHPEHHHDK